MEEQQLIEKVRDILAEEFEVDRDLMLKTLLSCPHWI